MIHLERIRDDVCGLISPPSGSLDCFMVLIDVSSKWSRMCLLSSRNFAFARLLAQIIKLTAQFLDYTIKSIYFDNASEFTSPAFDNYHMSIGIRVKHLIAHVHTQNDLAKLFIKLLL